MQPKKPSELVNEGKQHVISFLKEAGWLNIPKFDIEQIHDPRVLGEYMGLSQFNGSPLININVGVISSFIVCDHLETMINTIGHELAHMAHEAAQYDPEYPKFDDHFADEEDMCEWFGWFLVLDTPETLMAHPYFGRWLKAIDTHYFYR